MEPNKEQVYDEQIHPLMAQILDICGKHGIAMIASFSIPTPEEDDLCCTSMMPNETGENDPSHVQAWRLLQGELLAAVAMTLTKAS